MDRFRHVSPGFLAVFLPLVLVFTAGALADGCEVCITVYKGLGGLGTTAYNCDSLAMFSSMYFSAALAGAPDVDLTVFQNFACTPDFMDDTITACAPDADDATAAAMYDTFDVNFDRSVELYFLLPYGISEINTCLHPRDDPSNLNNVSCTASCVRPTPAIQFPSATTSCESLPPGTSPVDEPSDWQAPPPPSHTHCGQAQDQGRRTVNVRKWLAARQR